MFYHRQAKMEMETEDDVAMEGSVEPPPSTVALVMPEEVEGEMAEKALARDEDLIASL
jgi:hypothetical protein